MASDDTERPPSPFTAMAALNTENNRRHDSIDALAEQVRQMQVRLRTLERQHESDDDRVNLIEGNGGGESRRVMRPRRTTLITESQMDLIQDNFELPEDTYTLLMTQPIFSIPFFVGLVAPGLAAACLILAFKNEWDNGGPGNPLGVPPGVRSSVRAAQYLGVIIGILMEEEIPNGLEIIGKGAEQELSGINRIGWRRILPVSILRMIIGYLFIFCLFLTVVQEDTVLEIFFDVLALEFVESLDDVIFGISKRGFFGHVLGVATNSTYVIECSSSERIRKRRKWFKRLIRFFYFANMLAGIAVLTSVTSLQMDGVFRCNVVLVDFGDAAWETAHVIGDKHDRVLIYSHFNGIYEEEERYGGRPRYVERNKEDGAPFRDVVPAEIVYCEAIEAWVFRHPNIRSKNHTEGVGNECNWLLRSQRTESFDLIELAAETEWNVWTSLVTPDYSIEMKCYECHQDSDCNYNGICVTNGREKTCDCFDDFYGMFCQFEQPCDIIRSEKDENTTLNLLRDFDDAEGEDFVEVYGRPMYYSRGFAGIPYNLLRLGFPDDTDEYFGISYPSNITNGNVNPHKHYHTKYFDDDDFFEVNNETEVYHELLKNYTFVLRFTGQRWYGQIIPPGMTSESFKEEEYHAFWNNAFSGMGEQDNRTLLISSPSIDSGSPVGVDFFEMRRRNIVFESGKYDYDYGPYGVLIPVNGGYEGSGWFHCNRND